MGKTLTAVFDGKELQFEASLDLELNGRYRVTIEPETEPEIGPEMESAVESGIEPPTEVIHNGDIWDWLDSVAGSIKAPRDWSSETDHYLHGTPKHSAEDEA